MHNIIAEVGATRCGAMNSHCTPPRPHADAICAPAPCRQPVEPAASRLHHLGLLPCAPAASAQCHHLRSPAAVDRRRVLVLGVHPVPFEASRISDGLTPPVPAVAHRLAAAGDTVLIIAGMPFGERRQHFNLLHVGRAAGRPDRRAAH